MHICESVRACRLAANLTQRQVAESLSVAPAAVAQWESGVKVPTTRNLMALADLYRVSLDKLTGRNTS